MTRFLILFLTALAASSHAVEIRDLPYVKNGDPRQKLDLYLPNRKSVQPRPVIVAIHGGAWAIGDKSNKGFVEPKFEWLNSQGFIVASVNYRLSPKVEHPAHIEDICSAIAWLQRNVSKYDGDPRRIQLLGHSAGAHLAALAAVDQDRLKKAGADPSAIRGVILLDGACYDVPRQMRSGTILARSKGMYVDAFTTNIETQKDASPVYKVSKKAPPFLILHVAGRRDSTEQATRLAGALKKQGGWVLVRAIRGKNHKTINQDLGKPGDPTTEAVAAFLGLDDPPPAQSK